MISELAEAFVHGFVWGLVTSRGAASCLGSWHRSGSPRLTVLPDAQDTVSLFTNLVNSSLGGMNLRPVHWTTLHRKVPGHRPHPRPQAAAS